MKALNLNTIILSLALAGGGFFAHHIDRSMNELQEAVQERNDRLIRVEEAVAGLRSAIDRVDRSDDVRAMNERIIVLEQFHRGDMSRKR